MTNVVIAGSRTFNDFTLLEYKCNEILLPYKDITIISGCAKGADRLGELYALDKGYTLHRMPAKWSIYGKSAGFIRNEQMAKLCDLSILFWDGRSRGTWDMYKTCKLLKKQVKVVPI